jgi:gluconolactonase
VLVASAVVLLYAPPSQAVPDCSPLPPARVVVSDQGRLESITSDPRGRLFYTDLTNNRLLRLDGPGSEPKTLATDIARPGGLAFDADGSLVTGFSGGALSGVPGNGMAGLLRIDPESGAKRPFVAGLDQANGLVRGPDGSFYTSNNISGEIARVGPDGSAQRNWARLESPNGLVIDRQQRYVFAAQTFTPAKVARIELAHPDRQTTFFEAQSGDTAAGLDGLTRDAADRLFVAANGAGEVWRIDAQGHACALARNLGLPSALDFGGGGAGFDQRNLYVVTFGGAVVELEGATDRPPSARTAPADRSRPRIAIRGVPRRCVSRRFRVRVRIRDRSALQEARARLDGRLLRRTRAKRFRFSVRARRLRTGRHRIGVAAHDVAGNRGLKRVHFRRC